MEKGPKKQKALVPKVSARLIPRMLKRPKTNGAFNCMLQIGERQRLGLIVICVEVPKGEITRGHGTICKGCFRALRHYKVNSALSLTLCGVGVEFVFFFFGGDQRQKATGDLCSGESFLCCS